MLKLSIGWIVAGVAALGTVAYVALTGKKSSSSPKALTKVPFNPDEDACDIAYGMLPDDVQEMYNNAVIAANVDTAKLALVKNMVNAIAQDPDIDDVAKRTFQKCFWKKAAQSGQATIAEAIAAVPSLATVLAGNALPEGDDEDGDDTDDDEDDSGLYGKKPAIVTETSEAFDDAIDTNFDPATEYEQVANKSAWWPGVNALPPSAVKNDALSIINRVDYPWWKENTAVLCAGSPCPSSLHFRALAQRIEAENWGFQPGLGEIIRNAMNELNSVAWRLESDGL